MQSEQKPLLHASERRSELLNMLRSQGRIDVATAAEELKTSNETIRKDLIALEQQGFLRRVHGGALPMHVTTFEPDLASRTQHLEEKRKVAAAALAHLPKEGAIFIDAGSTTQFFAEMLPSNANFTVFTNALTIAQVLVTKPGITCHTLGGRLRGQTMAEVGPWAMRALGELHIDVAFVGTNALSFNRGLSTPHPEEAAIKSLMIANSARSILLTDHTKFGQDALVKYADLSELDVVITSKEASAEHVAELEIAKPTLELV